VRYGITVQLLSRKELRNLYSSPNIIRIIKSRRIRWIRNVAHIGRNKCIPTTFLSENPKGRDHYGNLSVNGRITLRWIVR
jgi:hypothetical protein